MCAWLKHLVLTMIVILQSGGPVKTRVHSNTDSKREEFQTRALDLRNILHKVNRRCLSNTFVYYKEVLIASC